MDVLTLCWAFDKRWVFGVELRLQLLWVPVFIDMLTVLGLALEAGVPACSTTANQVILSLIVVGHILIAGISYVKTRKQKQMSYGNQVQIQNFMLSYHTKKTIWSPIGMFILTMSFILLLLECCQTCIARCGTALTIIRIVIDMACWAYLALMLLIFVLCKIAYLVWAWKFPESYLRYRKVIN